MISVRRPPRHVRVLALGGPAGRHRAHHRGDHPQGEREGVHGQGRAPPREAPPSGPAGSRVCPGQSVPVPQVEKQQKPVLKSLWGRA